MIPCNICGAAITTPRFTKYCSPNCQRKGKQVRENTRRIAYRSTPEYLKEVLSKKRVCKECGVKYSRLKKTSGSKYCGDSCRKLGVLRISRKRTYQKGAPPALVACSVCSSPFMGTSQAILCSDPCRRARRREKYRESLKKRPPIKRGQ